MTANEASPWQLVEQGRSDNRASLPEKGTLIIGSSAERSDFTLSGQGVEDAHCAIGCVKQGGWAIKDLGSRFGSFVNGEEVRSKRLALGDVIVLGSVRLEVTEAGAEPLQPVQSSESSGSSGSSGSLGPLETLEPVDAGAGSAPAPGVQPQGSSGRQLGGYRIESTLGKGGMGEVVLAVQESLNRHVAIKLLSTRLASDLEFVQAFHSEARSAAALNHPNVVVVHDVGVEAGQHYLAMEYMPGGSLEERVLNDGKLPWREVLNILHDAAAGLAYAESQGIVHRDIKPANLMLAESGAIKIADLGLALNLDEQGAGDSAEGRKTFGTPHFISPEQARGLAVDQRSDLYSLGATAYRLLSGRTPFQGETAREIVRARFVSDPPSLAASVPGLPEGLHELVHRLMQREPELRFSSARELLSAVDLLRLRADHGPAADEPAAAPAEEESKSRLLPLSLLGLVLLAAGAFFFLGGESEDPKEQPGTAQASSSTGGENQGDRGNQLGASDSEDFFGDPSGAPEGSGQTEEDELRLLRLERDALTELARLPNDLTAAERIQELRSLAARFEGTDTATQALAEVERLGISELQAHQQAAQASAQLDQTLAALRTHIGWPQPDTNPASLEVLLGRLGAYLPPSELSGEPSFLQGVEELRAEIIQALGASAEARIQAAELSAADGDFEPLRAALEASRLSLWPGEPSPDEAPQLAQARAESEAFQARLASLDAVELQFNLERARADRQLLAGCLGPASGLRGELLDLELEAILARIEATRGQLQTRATRHKLEQVAGVIEAAQRALVLLGSTHEASLWKRRTISVPRTSTRSSAEDAVGVVPEGILVADGDATRLVEWSTFSRSDSDLKQLFQSRLSRPWSEAEVADIASLLSLPALAKALELAGPGLLTEAQLSLSPRKVQAMGATLDEALAWIESETGMDALALAALDTQPRPEADQRAPTWLFQRVALEQQALQVLGRALVASQEDAHSLTISIIETLLEDYAETLLVLMLSSDTP